jgi:hypothetical protein
VSPIAVEHNGDYLAIKVVKISEDLYHVAAIAPQWQGAEEWSPADPLSAKQIAEALFVRGFHQQDIADAIHAADQEWSNRSDDPHALSYLS